MVTAAELGWHRLANGKLLDAAEADGFDVFVTADKGFQFQQNLAMRRIGIVVLSRGSWTDVKPWVARVQQAVASVLGGSCVLVECADLASDTPHPN